MSTSKTNKGIPSVKTLIFFKKAVFIESQILGFEILVKINCAFFFLATLLKNSSEARFEITHVIFLSTIHDE